MVLEDNFIQWTMGSMNFLQHTKKHPIIIDCECCSTLHQLCGSGIIKGGAIGYHSTTMRESDEFITTLGRCHWQ